MPLPACTELSNSTISTVVDRSGDLPTDGSFIYYLRNSRTAGKLFCLASQNAGTTVVMSAIVYTATTTGFTNVTSVRIPSGNIGGYGVDPTGNIHICCVSITGTMYRFT